MNVIHFNGRAYTPEVLATMDMTELTNLHNQVASLTDGIEAPQPPYGFVDLATAQKATWVKLERLGEARNEVRELLGVDEPPIATKEPTKRAAPSRRVKRFKFPTTEKVSRPRAGTLRLRVLELLSRPTGATYDEVVEQVRWFDRERNKEERNVERRAYEVIRLLHYYNGYGITHEGDRLGIKEKAA